jgi:hypothetical protein
MVRQPGLKPTVPAHLRVGMWLRFGGATGRTPNAIPRGSACNQQRKEFSNGQI